ncbi:MAG: HK97 family phage prohead protease [Pseudomonadota bacterium]
MEALHFEGMAAIFGEPDRTRDVFDCGAFTKSLRASWKVRLLLNHNTDCVIGCIDDLQETSRGLYVRAHITPDLEVNRDVARLIKDGALDGLSVGFKTRKSRRDGGVRYISEAELWEVSVVTFPMAPNARIEMHGCRAAA